MATDAMPNPRQVIVQRLQQDLGQVEPADIRTAVLCGEMGCDEVTQQYIQSHPGLRCPYQGRVEDPQGHCKQLRTAYLVAVKASRGGL